MIQRIQLFLLFTLLLHADTLTAQSEVMAWGNLLGIRVEGELMAFESSLCLIGSNLREVTHTAKEAQRPRYQLGGSKQIIKTNLGDIDFVEEIEDLGKGKIRLSIQATARADTQMTGAFLCIRLPLPDFRDADIQLVDSTGSTLTDDNSPQARRMRRFNRNIRASVKGLKIFSESRKLHIETGEATNIIVQPDNPYFGSGETQIFFAILPGDAVKGQAAGITIHLTMSGKVDKTSIHLGVDTQNPGRRFDGIGGNFRLQDPEHDPQVIDYCLTNLYVTWGRVEMPWSSWHPNESVDPLIEARRGNLNPGVEAAMLMAQRLSKQNIPVIVSAWRAPGWAILGETGFRRRQPGDPRGNPLNPAKMKSILKSITSYILYLKEAYGVEAVLFSFNESDLGINVRQTGEEHAELIKTLGAHMASYGLSTKLLLGDNSDANTYAFIEPAMQDPETHKFIGALSFHSWRGCDNWTLSIWADAARAMNVPLLVGEGSTDASAHRHPDIFLQPVYARNEIDTYLRICSICQTRAILQWQLTSDYAVMTGAGIYGSEGPLTPTQRFWNLKQLGLTPKGSFHLPMTCDRPNVSCAAMGDIANEIYTVHLVNNGADRKVILSGLPDTVRRLRVYVTDSERAMKEKSVVRVHEGQAEFSLDSAGFTTLVSEPTQ